MGNPVTPAQADFLRRLCRTHGVTEPPVSDFTGESIKAHILRIVDGDLGGHNKKTYPDAAQAGITQWQIHQIMRQCEDLWGDPYSPQVYALIEKSFSKLLCVGDLSRRQASRIIVELDKLEAS